MNGQCVNDTKPSTVRLCGHGAKAAGGGRGQRTHSRVKLGPVSTGLDTAVSPLWVSPWPSIKLYTREDTLENQ